MTHVHMRPFKLLLHHERTIRAELNRLKAEIARSSEQGPVEPDDQGAIHDDHAFPEHPSVVEAADFLEKLNSERQAQKVLLAKHLQLLIDFMDREIDGGYSTAAKKRPRRHDS